MTPEILIVAVIVGLATWAMRFLPTKLRLGAGKPESPLSRFLAATGPAAIAALFAAAFLPHLTGPADGLPPLAAGTAGVVAMFLYRRDVALATFAGAIVYGIVFALMA